MDDDGAPTEPIPAAEGTEPTERIEPTEPVGWAAPAEEPTRRRPDPWDPPRPSRAGRRPAMVLVVLLVVSLLANAALAVAWWRADDRAGDREEQLASMRSRLEELERRAADDAPGGGDLDDLFGELFGDGGPGGEELDDLLDDLLGDGLGDVFGGLGPSGACLGSLAGDMFGERVEIPDDDLMSQYEATARWVEEERGLRFEELPEPTFVTPDEIRERVAEEVRRTYSEADARLDSQLLAALGVVDPGTDLLELQSDLLGGQVAGYYDPRDGELVVATEDPSEPLDANGIIALAHELDHALTDQALDLPVDDDAPASSSDEHLAATALVEGDATLLMYRFSAVAVSLEDQLGMSFDPELGDALEALASTPHYLAAEMQFPYTEGLGLVCSLQSDGDWDAVDRAYDDPPSDTAQVLYPERYVDGARAADPDDPGAPGDGWEEQRRGVFGAAPLLWLFEAPGDNTGVALDRARDRAAAWDGGEYAQWTRGGDVAVGISLREREGEHDLCESVRTWYRAAFPMAEVDESGDDRVAFEDGRQAARVRCRDGEVRLGIAPEPAVATRIAG